MTNKDVEAILVSNLSSSLSTSGYDFVPENTPYSVTKDSPYVEGFFMPSNPEERMFSGAYMFVGLYQCSIHVPANNGTGLFHTITESIEDSLKGNLRTSGISGRVCITSMSISPAQNDKVWYNRAITFTWRAFNE
jgi:hypothetical protein